MTMWTVGTGLTRWTTAAINPSKSPIVVGIGKSDSSVCGGT